MIYGPTGCVISEEYTMEVCERMDQAGRVVAVGDRPGIAGQWDQFTQRGSTGIYLWKAEHERLGRLGADHQKRGTCFPAGSPVTMSEEGIRLPIEAVRVGDTVLTHRGNFREVTDTSKEMFTGTMIGVHFHEGKDPLICTWDHELCVLREIGNTIEQVDWVQAADLSIGDMIVVPIGSGGFFVDTISDLTSTQVTTPVDVYCLEVEDDESFTVSGYAVHNCVGRGTYRALQLSYLHFITYGLGVGNPVKIAYEPIYAGSREVVGRGRLGSGDGSVGGWAAEWLDGYGFVPRGVYGNLDLSKDNESWACSRMDIPQEILDLGKLHLVRAHLCKTTDDIFDALASGFALARCHNTLYGPRDSNGESRASRKGAHCQAIVGAYLREDGRSRGVIEQQSWGNGNPSGQSILKTAGGDVKLPPGCYGISEEELDKALRKDGWAEAWAFAPEAEGTYR